MSDNYVYIKMK